MKERTHARHKLVCIVTIALLIVLSLAFLFLALYNHNPLEDHNHTTQILGIVFIVLLGCAGIIGVLGSYFSKCPDCKGWIKRYRSEQNNDARIRFICKKCNILFDSGIEESTD